MPSVSYSRDRRREEERNARLSAEAEASLANITAHLSSWTSDRVGSVPLARSPPSPRFYSPMSGGGDEDEVSWMKNILDQDEQEEDVMDAAVSPRQASLFPSTPRQSTGRPNHPGLERADTPVHSNSKKTPDEGDGSGGTSGRYSSLVKKRSLQPSESDLDAENTPSPIRTPAGPGATGSISSVRRAIQTPRSVRKMSHQTLAVEDRQQVQTCQRYHDTLLRYLQAKRRWIERHELASSSAVVAAEEPGQVNTAGLLGKEHSRLQEDFLRGLASLCYEEQAAGQNNHTVPVNGSKEGNFWNLLAHLRRLGMDALLWRDDGSVQFMTQMEMLAQEQQQNEAVTQLEILQLLQKLGENRTEDEPTSIIQRRYQVLAWLEDCFAQKLPFPLKTNRGFTNTSKPADTFAYKRDSKLYKEQGLAETEKDSQLLRQALSLVLAGRLSQAQQLMRSNGLSWRAAVWGGGKPMGYEIKQNPLDGERSKVRVGNPNRALWQSMLWRQAEEPNGQTMLHEERAIASLLCNNVKSSFANPVLRSWEKALYAGVKAIVGRTEDVLLYQGNPNKFARSHLEATADMAGMDESNLIDTLARTPYPEMQANDLFTTATAAFLIGQAGVKFLLQDMDKNMQESSGDANVLLRFVAHLVLYLDSTMEDPAARAITAPIQWDLKHIKDRIVVDYLQSLAYRELWSLLVLYGSLLPREIMLQHLPPLLVPVVNDNDRKMIVSQLREIQPIAELEVLRAVVKQEEKNTLLLGNDDDDMLGEQEDEVLGNGDKDDKMMKALTWFCVMDGHAQEALVYSNSLVRRFLLEEKLDSVFHFVENVRPANLVSKLVEQCDGDEDMEDETKHKTLLSEYYSYEKYLDAERAVARWQGCMENAFADSTAISQSFANHHQSMEAWNEIEREVALSERRRQLLEQKRITTEHVILAANAAHEATLAVLQYEGGWLWHEEDSKRKGKFDGDADMEEDEDGEVAVTEAKRQREELRKQILPHIAMLHGTVCEETAAWAEDSLQQTASGLSSPDSAVPMRDALMKLDSSVSTLAGQEKMKMSSSSFSPTFWTRHAMEIANTLASDACNIPVNETVLDHMAKITVLHLQYSADLEEESGL